MTKNYIRYSERQDAVVLTPELEAMIDEFDEKLVQAGVVHLIFVQAEEETKSWGRVTVVFADEVMNALLDVWALIKVHFKKGGNHA